MTTTVPGDRTTAPAGLMDAFWAYERALMADDLAELDRLFDPGDETLRGDASGLLVGHQQISDYRARRGGAPQRRVVEHHVRTFGDDHALVVAVTELVAGDRGLQTQLWSRREGTAGTHEWKVVAAHVHQGPPALDTRVWRVVGDPLVPATLSAPGDRTLTGETVAVKDLYAVQGHPVGAGNPTWLRHTAPEPAHAHAVERLLGSGAAIRGIARTDEFAYSLAGMNAHYGTPPNPRAPHRLPGGSSNGPASAVSLGHASIGLGTDTGGSVRVPAAYQGLFGIRTSHGAVPVAGLLPLAPAFDTVGWLTRSAALLEAVGTVLLPKQPTDPRPELVMSRPLLDVATPEVAEAVRAWLPASTSQSQWSPDLSTWKTAFQTVQAFQAWETHGRWLRDRLDSLGSDVRARFARASTVTPHEARAAEAVLGDARTAIREFVADRVLVLPSAASVAPRPDDDIEAVREATLRLTCIAGIGGLPAVSLPLRSASGLPVGVCLVAAPHRDRDLLKLAVELAGDPPR